MLLFFNASIACSAVSVGSSSVGSSANMRATSMATFPAPMTTAVSASNGVSTPTKSGCALYQGTKTAADSDPRRFSPGIPKLFPKEEPVAIITASYFCCSCATVMSPPTSTLANNRNFSWEAIFSNTFATVLIFGWSGATPLRTNPHGVGRRSIMSIINSRSSLARF